VNARTYRSTCVDAVHLGNVVVRIDVFGRITVNPEPLADEDVDHFVRNGYVVVKECFSPESAQEWIDRAWVRLGYDRNDPSQWLEKRIHLSATRRSPSGRPFWSAACPIPAVCRA
jgi:hypothetical protein